MLQITSMFKTLLYTSRNLVFHTHYNIDMHSFSSLEVKQEVRGRSKEDKIHEQKT